MPLDTERDQHFLYWLEKTHSELFMQVLKDYQTQLNIFKTSYPQYQVPNSPDYVQYEAGKKSALAQVKPKLNAIKDQVQYN